MTCSRHNGPHWHRGPRSPADEGRRAAPEAGQSPPPPPGAGWRGTSRRCGPCGPAGMGPPGARPERDDPFNGSPNPHRLYRNRDNRVLFGVAAGFADYTGIAVWKIRALVIVLAMFFLPQVLLVYGIMAIALKPRPGPLYRDEREERFWRSVSFKPAETFGTIRHKFRELDRRLIAMERTVTSEEYRLRREFTAMETGRPPPNA